MDRNKILFKMDEMEYKKFGRDEKEKNITKLDVPESTRVLLSGVGFKENIASRIDVFKYEGDKRSIIFVEIFMGNIEIASKLYYSDVVVYIEKDNDVHGNEYIRGFDIRKAENYDY